MPLLRALVYICIRSHYGQKFQIGTFDHSATISSWNFRTVVGGVALHIFVPYPTGGIICYIDDTLVVTAADNIPMPKQKINATPDAIDKHI